MFPERPVKPEIKPTAPPGLEIYRGQKKTCGIQLVVDKIWRYSLQEGETLTVEIRKADNSVIISKKFTKSDVDYGDKIITVNYSEEDTIKLNVGERYFITALVDGYVVLPAQPVTVKEVVSNERS